MTARISKLVMHAGLGLLAALIAATALANAADAAADTTATADPAQPPAEVIYLRGDITVDGPMVTLGDMLVGVPEHLYEVPVARSPDPGQQGRIRTGSVARVAQMHGLEWTPFAQTRSIEVTRRGRLVEQSELTRVILDALQPQLADGDHEIYLNGRVRDTFVSLDTVVDPQVESLDFRADTGRFDAVVRLSHGTQTRPLRLTGMVTEMADLPVLRTRMEAGEVIAAADITYRKVRADRVPANIITEAEDLIGRTPRRVVAAGRHVRANDIIVPQDVARNDMVTMVVNNGGMLLTTTGQALESGARGEVIGVRNMRSKRVVRGIIVGPGEVHMVGNGFVTPANAGLANARHTSG